jgi:hypothetical protein
MNALHEKPPTETESKAVRQGDAFDTHPAHPQYQTTACPYTLGESEDHGEHFLN